MARTKAGLESKFDARIAYLKKQIVVLQEELATAEKHKAEFPDNRERYEFYKSIEAEEIISPIVKSRKPRTTLGTGKASIIAAKGGEVGNG
jgi:hypothetical protein